MVRLDGVTKRFGTVTAAEDVSFALHQGEFLTILGPSGSGKTTVLRMIAGFMQPTAGTILLGGRPVSELPPHRRSIGMVFQRLALFPHMTAAGNIAYPLKMRGFPRAEIPKRVERFLALVQLHGLGDRRINELSGGQQQRVAIARALSFEPDLLLLDEPLASLDRKLREDMQLEFRRIQQELGVATINVTHDQREALVMSDRVIVMDGGRVQQAAAPQDAYRQPANRFVAGFIGVTNFLACTVLEAHDGEAEVEIGDHRCAGRSAAGGEAVGRTADAALRAEQVLIGEAGQAIAHADMLVPATVTEVIFEGDRVVYAVDAPTLGGASLRIFDHDPLHHKTRRIGETVTIGWKRRDLMVFPRDA